MSRYSRSDPEMLDYDKPSVCASFMHYTWKTITCLLSHITLVSMVVSYCVLGAFTFEALEVHHEKDIKRNISKLRYNVTSHLWNLTTSLDVLREDKFKLGAETYLKEFEGAILKAMTKDGWDGEEDPNIVQWTSTGALFYSIIVITTIGYGHISPKTQWGKIVTIFYAILGIPLMLLCLSNIGDIMATSFRFLYWRVCCYFCTKRPKRKRSKRGSTRSSARMTPEGRFSRSRNPSFRRSVRTSTKSADSGFGRSEIGHYSHSDTELRYHEDSRDQHTSRGSSLPRMRPSQISRFSDSSVPQNRRKSSQTRKSGSLDRRKDHDMIEMDPIILAKTPILCNKYVVDKNEITSNNIPGITMRELEGQGAKSLSRNPQYLELPRASSPGSSSQGSRRSPRPRRKKSPVRHNPSPKMMTPLGYGHRSKYLDDPDSEEEFYEDEDDYYEIVRTRIRPVPIWLCVFLVVSYIVAGAFLFKSWENWELLDAAYFCFITLTTIGFGDLVPAKGVTHDTLGDGIIDDVDVNRATISIALCSLYLLFGIALLAMSFNLVQEEVIAKVKRVAKTLGIIKKDEEDSEDEV
ncbi:uncharacterized protein LOC123008529 [Tribolium madens]|uniref:uncharacterized protein LOC123008529 n=1 Tax=Tribolium madens TaxID=41895 RepID=UPI001CF73555|nr:uncharacterized protein LOC123008529 [Tribolium madens]